ncbi:MAG TPA: type II secretion system F family protein [Ktedonobacterales bacterium]|jgi:tight adherence protein C|nr:type II secretion system F family protein [Ktedonobacterales bacterium]
MTEVLKHWLPAVAGFLAFFAVLFVVIGAAIPARRDDVEVRLDLLTAGSRRTLEEIELQAPFMERFAKPFLKQLSKLISRLTPAGAMESMQRELLHAGLSGRLQVSDFLGLRTLTTILGIGLAVGVGLLFNQGTFGFLLLLILFGGIGYLIPVLWLRQQTNKRRGEVLRALPDVIDLLTISVEAGLGFDLALARVVSKSDSALSREFARVLTEMRYGIARRDALRALAERTGVEDLGAFISAIIQAEQLGASVANVLRIQSVEMRVRRRQNAERLAQVAPIKMLFPMAFLIFPPIFVVVLGPAIPHVVHAFAPTFPL